MAKIYKYQCWTSNFLDKFRGILNIIVLHETVYVSKLTNLKLMSDLEIWSFDSMSTPDFQELFESRIKNYFYVRRDSYVAKRVKTIPFPPSHGDLHFKYSFSF